MGRILCETNARLGNQKVFSRQHGSVNNRKVQDSETPLVIGPFFP